MLVINFQRWEFLFDFEKLLVHQNSTATAPLTLYIVACRLQTSINTERDISFHVYDVYFSKG